MQLNTLTVFLFGYFMMTEEINFKILQNRFNEIKDFYSSENYKYIHARTVENFLAHADNFSIKRHRQKIYNTLWKYFDIISSTQIDNVAESQKLFDAFIRPLTIIFSESIGFHTAVRLWIMIVWAVPVFALLYLIKAPVYFYTGLAVFIILLLIRQLYFNAQKKTQGFMY
jgi:hypothetical protein